MDQLLKDFARAIAPGPTRALANKSTGSLTVFVEDGPVGASTVVVARCGQEYVTGRITHPSPGWVQIAGVVYPTSQVEVRGLVLFVARPIPGDEETAKGGQRG
jgi:hypothetical protein